MKNTSTYFLALLLSLAISTSAFAQASGPVAHWPMNGNPNDTSGNAHHGLLHNVTPTTGRDGFPNSAYYFSGAGSFISVPHSQDWNVTQYTIGAVLKPTAFNTQPCQASYVVARGPQTVGRWAMMYTDNIGTTNGCGDLDTSAFYFQHYPGLAVNGAGNVNYAPAITTNQWYTVICTFNGSAAKTYVNGVLKSTITYTSGMQPTFDSVVIGRENPSPSSQIPFHFIGVLDDLRFYNRVLSETEITGYGIPLPASVEEATATADVQLGPNPAADFVDVRLGTAPATATDVQLFNAVGQVVHQVRFTGASTRIMLSDFAAGIYSLRLSSGAGTWVRQVVKQ